RRSSAGAAGEGATGPVRGEIAPRAAGEELVGGGVGGLAERTAVRDATLGQVVRRDGDGDDVAGQNADEVLANLARNMRNDLVAVVQFHAKLGVRQGRHDLALYHDCFFLCHALSLTGSEM